jgi:hypothetical protein
MVTELGGTRTGRTATGADPLGKTGGNS